MTTFDLILVALTVVMYIAMVAGTVLFVKKGMNPLDALMEMLAVMTFTTGGMNRSTLVYNVGVVLSVLLFAWIFTVPAYTALFFTTYVLSWVLQIALHKTTNTEYKNHLTFGLKVGQIFF